MIISENIPPQASPHDDLVDNLPIELYKYMISTEYHMRPWYTHLCPKFHNFSFF